MYNSFPYYAPLPLTPQHERSMLRNSMNKIGIVLVIVYIVMNMVSFFFMMISGALSFVGAGDYAFSDANQAIVMGITSITALFLGSVMVSSFEGVPLHANLPVRRLQRGKLVWLFFAGAAVCTIANYGVELFLYVFRLIGVDLSSGMDAPMGSYKTPFDAVIMLVSVAIIPALLEEMLFRGVILHVLRRYGDGFAIIMTSVLFALLHGNFVQIPFAFAVGLVFAVLTVYSGSIIPSILVHFFNNSISVLQEVLSDRISEESLVIIFVCLNVVTVVLGVVGALVTARNNRDFLKITDKPGQLVQNPLRSRIISGLTTPGTGFFIVMMTLISVFMVGQGTKV